MFWSGTCSVCATLAGCVVRRGVRGLTVEIFNKKIDWMIVAIPSALAIYLFYGLVPALVALAVFAALIALKPIHALFETPRSRVALALGVVMLLSPLLRLVFFEGYCVDGRFSPFFGPFSATNMAADYCRENLWGNFDSQGGTGYVRDIGFPLIGIISLLIAFRWRQRKVSM